MARFLYLRLPALLVCGIVLLSAAALLWPGEGGLYAGLVPPAPVTVDLMSSSLSCDDVLYLEELELLSGTRC